MVGHLIITYGKDKFIKYMKQFLMDSDHDRVFESIYGIDFNTYLLNFNECAQGLAEP